MIIYRCQWYHWFNSRYLIKNVVIKTSKWIPISIKVNWPIYDLNLIWTLNIYHTRFSYYYNHLILRLWKNIIPLTLLLKFTNILRSHSHSTFTFHILRYSVKCKNVVLIFNCNTVSLLYNLILLSKIFSTYTYSFNKIWIKNYKEVIHFFVWLHRQNYYLRKNLFHYYSL